jgi:AcrR family transcriptional regulator
MALQKGRRDNQRERLLVAMTQIATGEGYAATNVAEVIALAGVSRPTFYDYFPDLDGCFLAAVDQARQLVFPEIRDAIALAPAGDAIPTAIAGLIAFASSQPTAARMLMSETTLAGPVSLGARTAAIAQIAELIEAQHARLAPSTPVPDLNPVMLVGAVYRLLARRVRRGERNFPTLLAELSTWLVDHEQPLEAHRWSMLKPAPALPRCPFATELPLYAPPPLAPGRQHLSSEEVAHNHRERILVAVARVSEEKGLYDATLADIIAAAGIDRRAFYRIFHDKEEAVAALRELTIQHVMMNTGRAFFSGATWPERIWVSGLAIAQMLDLDSTIAGFFEAEAAGLAAFQRVDELMSNYAIFYQEGFQYSTRPDPPTPLALEAMIATNFELTHIRIRADGPVHMAAYLPHMANNSLTPFLGYEAANEFIEGKLAEARDA